MSETVPEPLQRVTFCEVSGAAIPTPMDPAFALTDADKQSLTVVKSGPWLAAGAWKWREFGREVQLRNFRLPHLALDLFRVEAEQLAFALGSVLSKPMPLPYRVPWWERARQWWQRAVWNRKHARELDEHRAAIIEHALSSMPQMDDKK